MCHATSEGMTLHRQDGDYCQLFLFFVGISYVWMISPGRIVVIDWSFEAFTGYSIGPCFLVRWWVENDGMYE